MQANYTGNCKVSKSFCLNYIFAKLLISSCREQKLANLMHDKKYLKAIGLAITLDQPFKVLNVIKG